MSPASNWLIQRRNAFILGAILLLGAALRFPDLGRESFWGDEIMLAKAAILPTVGETVKDIQIPHSVGYPILLHYWMKIGTSEEMVRFPSAVAGIFSILLLYLFLNRVFGARVGFVAALFLALSAPQIRFSREAAAYSIQNAVLIGAGMVWVQALQTNGWTHWLGFAVLAALTHYLHPLASTTTIGWFLLTWLLWLRGNGRDRTAISVEPRSVNLRKWFVSFLVFCVLVLPQFLRNLEGAGKNVRTSAEALTFNDYTRELLELLGGTCSPLLPLILIGTATLLCASLFFGLAFVGWACGTLVVWAAFSSAEAYHFDSHYFLSHVPAFMVLAAFGVEGIAKCLQLFIRLTGYSGRRAASAAAAVAALVAGYLMLPSARAERARIWPDYRAAGTFLANRLNPEDRYYLKPEYWLPAKMDYYLRDVKDQEVGIEVFSNEIFHHEIDRLGGTLYIVTNQAFGKSDRYRSRAFHGAAVNWRDPRSPTPMDYEDAYEQMHASSGKENALDLLSEAKQFEAAGNLDKACEILIRAAEEAPHRYDVQRRKAEVLTELGRHEEAVAAFEAAYQRAPRKDRWWMLVGKARNFLALGKGEAGLDTLRQALDVATDESERSFLYEAIGEYLMVQGQLDEAESAFRRSLDLWEGDREISLLGLGDIAARRKREAEALGYYERAAALNAPNKPRAEERIRNLREKARRSPKPE